MKSTRTQRSTSLACWLAAGIGFALSETADAQINIPSFGTPVTQNFDALTSAPEGALSSALPPGWLLYESGTDANTTYRVSNGSLATGDVYSFGSAASGDRAFGTLQTGSLAFPRVGAVFVNGTGAPIGSITFSFTGEQWRLGTLGRVDRLDFQVSDDATSLETGTWLDLNALDIPSVTITGSTGPLDGNHPANRVELTYTHDLGIEGPIPPGGVIWIRWWDFNASGPDDGLAVDDFSLQAWPLPSVPAANWRGIPLLALLLGAASWLGLRVASPGHPGLAESPPSRRPQSWVNHR